MRNSALVQTDVRPTGFPPVAQTLPKAIRRLTRKLKPEKIILFGSYAYGNPTPDSDVDLLIIMNTRLKRQVDRYVQAALALNANEFPVDIIVKTPKEIKDALKGGAPNGFFIRDILENGKPLYERSRRTRRLDRARGR